MNPLHEAFVIIIVIVEPKRRFPRGRGRGRAWAAACAAAAWAAASAYVLEVSQQVAIYAAKGEADDDSSVGIFTRVANICKRNVALGIAVASRRLQYAAI